jgi:hypothetical protein
MKSIGEIQVMLLSEIWSSIEKTIPVRPNSGYFNEYLGDSSFLLAGLLEAHLLDRFTDWASGKWMDDSLLIDVSLVDSNLSICGVMIWGVTENTEQWTEPFSFIIRLNYDDLTFYEYTFLFGDLNKSEVSYGYFKSNTEHWSTIERDWKYIVNVKN